VPRAAVPSGGCWSSRCPSLHLVETNYTFLAPGSPGVEATARCAKGDHLLTGGYGSAELAPGAAIAADRPSVLAASTGWTLIVLPGTSAATSKFKVYALCETER